LVDLLKAKNYNKIKQIVDSIYSSTAKTGGKTFGLPKTVFAELQVDVTALQAGAYYERAIAGGLIRIKTINHLDAFLRKTICSIDTGIF
jgi:hypothetical protein